jgi:pyruvate/2-oxoglutarate dehydrogenase complex dihydrolipoamide acyltransferase (E2) component
MPALLLPKFAESLTEARVVSWLVQAGDRVKAGQPLVVVETDKMTVEVEAETACVVTKLLASEGAVVEVGGPLCDLETAARPAAPVVAGSPEVLSGDVELRAIDEHRGRWQGTPPSLTAYFVVAASRAFPEWTSIGVAKADAKGDVFAPVDAKGKPLLLVERGLRELGATSATSLRVEAACGTFTVEWAEPSGGSAKMTMRGPGGAAIFDELRRAIREWEVRQ